EKAREEALRRGVPQHTRPPRQDGEQGRHHRRRVLRRPDEEEGGQAPRRGLGCVPARVRPPARDTVHRPPDKGGQRADRRGPGGPGGWKDTDHIRHGLQVTITSDRYGVMPFPISTLDDLRARTRYVILDKES